MAASITNPPDHGTLHYVQTGDTAPATAAQREASFKVGPEGIFLIDKDGDPIHESQRFDSWLQPVHQVWVEA